MTIAGIDAGNWDTKFVDGKVAKCFPSAIGGYRDMKLKNELGEFDFVYQFRGKRGFAGTLAVNESRSSSKKGLSKVHDEALLRILLALHQFSPDTEHHIVVGQPIKTHTDEEKLAYKAMVQDEHILEVNNVKKVIRIKRCEIAAEGVAVGLLPPTDTGTVRVIDIGSGTVNLGTVVNLRFRDLESVTFPFGTETVNVEDEEFARLICNMALDMWNKSDNVRVCGGGAPAVFQYIRLFFPNAILQPDPTFSNAKAFFELAKKVYA